MTRMTIFGTLLAACAAASTATADTAERFTMSPVEGGFLRLDKQTGAVSMCARADTTWSCMPVEDRSPPLMSSELSKLESENKDLKDRLKALEESLATRLPSDVPPPPGKTELPTEQEVDQALDYLERVYKKVRDRIKDLDKPLAPPAAEPVEPPKGSL